MRRALLFSKGDPSVFLARPISAVLIGVAVILLLTVFLPAVRGRRKTVFQEE